MKDLSIIIEKLFFEKIESLSNEYKNLKSRLNSTDYSYINTEINKRLESVKIPDHTRTLLIGSILKLTGSDEKDLLQFFSTYLKEKISLKQFNFIEFSIFNNNIPLSSDIVFDLTDYFLFEKKAIFKKAAALNECLEDDFNEKTLLFLFFLSYRNDLSNENRELIFHIFQAFAPKKITNTLKTHLFKGSINYKKDISLHRLKKQQTSLPFTGTSQPEEINISSKKAAGKSVKKTVPVKKKEIPAAALDEKSGFQPINITKKKYIYTTAISIVVIFLILLFTVILRKPAENSSFSGKGETGITGSNQQNRHAENKALMETEGEIGATPRELYTIVGGDTLSKISKKYYNNANMYYVIAEKNNIENPDWIFPGQIIVIPEIKDRSLKNGAED